MAINYHHLDNVVQEVGISNSIDNVIIFFTIYIQELRCFFFTFSPILLIEVCAHSNILHCF